MNMTGNAGKLHRDLLSLADAKTAASSQRFFKPRTGVTGDQFIGIQMPVMRKLVRQYRHLSLEDALSLLPADEHEVRMMALLMLVDQFQRGSLSQQRAVYQAYLEHTRYINNWDLVDASAHLILGAHLQNRSRKPLYRLAKSQDLWERRMAIIATFTFIRARDFEETLGIAEVLLSDPEDLINKAVGWMLREVGNRDRKTEEQFLERYYQTMPRTMLRYAIEKFPPGKRDDYLSR